MQNLQDLRKLNAEELGKELKRAEMKLTQAKIDLKTSQDKKSHTAKMYKRYIAQILTVEEEKKAETPAKEEKETEYKS